MTRRASRAARASRSSKQTSARWKRAPAVSKAAREDRRRAGQQISSFRDTGGQRRYITGLKLRGKRILILVDRSASMLHEDLVNVILLRNSSEAAKRSAAKWRRAIDTVTWLVTQLPAGSQFQVYGFNTRAAPVLASTAGKWQSARRSAASARPTLEALERARAAGRHEPGERLRCGHELHDPEAGPDHSDH